MRGRVDVGREESADGETCPCGGGRARGEGSLLAMRPVHAGEGGRGERGVCWRGDLSIRGRADGEQTLSRTHGRKRIGRSDGERVCR
jgi:hypothetical protein